MARQVRAMPPLPDPLADALPQPADLGPSPSGHARTRPLDLIFAALADPTRRAILRVLLEDDMAVTDVASGFPVSLAAVSRHLQVLAEAGLIAQERRGRINWCKLLPDGMREASVWMAAFGMIEAVDLDEFERFLRGEVGMGPADHQAGSSHGQWISEDPFRERP